MSDNDENQENIEHEEQRDEDEQPNDNLKRKRDESDEGVQPDEPVTGAEPPTKRQKKDKEKFNFPSPTDAPEIPVARVKRLVKSDPEVTQVTQEAVLVIAKATVSSFRE